MASAPTLHFKDIMALITITLQDSPDGPQIAVAAEPALPRSRIEGKPTPAQAAAALMLNALSSEVQAAGPAIIVPSH